MASSKLASFRHQVQFGSSEIMLNTPSELRAAANTIALNSGPEPDREQREEIKTFLSMLGYIPYVGYNTRPTREQVLRESNGILF